MAQDVKKRDEGQTPKPIMQTKKQLFWEIFRFLLVGGTATVIDYAISYLFYQWIFPPSLVGKTCSLLLSTALGFGAGVTVNWFLSVTFVFRAVRDKRAAASKRSFLIFLSIGLIGLLLTECGMLLVRVLPAVRLFSTTTFLGAEWTWWLMKATMTCLVLVWNYLGRKIFIFKS